MAEEDSVTRKPRRTFTPEQKAEAVRLAEEVGNVTQVARDLGIHRSSLVQWMQQAQIDAGQGPEGALTTDEKKELAALRRENHGKTGLGTFRFPSGIYPWQNQQLDYGLVLSRVVAQQGEG